MIEKRLKKRMIRKYFSVLTVIITMLIMLFGTLTAKEMSPDKLAKKIHAYFSKKIAADGPGAAVLVVKEGKVILRKSYGMANLELGVPMKPEMVFRIGSITKQFTAASILMLIEEGRISLNDEMNENVTNLSDVEILTSRI